MKKSLILSLSLVLALVMTAQAGNVMVIANKNVVVVSLTKAELQQIFLDKVMFWSNGKRVIPVIQKGGTAHADFLQKFLGLTPLQYDAYWKQAIFTGTGKPPKSVAGDSDVVLFVSATDGAVGYIDANTIQLPSVAIPFSNGDVKKIEVK